MRRVDARELYLFEHAHGHGSSVAPSEIVNLENLLYDGVPEIVYRDCPDEHANSMVWLLWHCARSEDVGINLMLTDGRPVFDGAWAEKMRVEDADIGTGMTVEDVRRISEGADLGAVRDYRRAVGLQTREVMENLDFGTLGEPPGPELPAAGWDPRPSGATAPGRAPGGRRSGRRRPRSGNPARRR